ncbi:MAG: hypothetical protein GY835_21570 [bacterium]|nr:hypothetical protein [bacterium]
MNQICQLCKHRGAQLSFSELTPAGKSTLMLCTSCALKLGVPVSGREQGVIDTEKIWEALVSELALQKSGEPLSCTSCGWTFASIEKSLSLGCPHCYRTFQGDMTRLLQNYHGNSKHIGKIPFALVRKLDLRRRILAIKSSIARSVKAERFEEAARQRDEVKDLERELVRLMGETKT